MSNIAQNQTSDNIDAKSSQLILPAFFLQTELDSHQLMDAKFEGDGLPDVDYKPGADFEVDDTLFQGVNMKEDFLDFGMGYSDHAYCNVEMEAPETSVVVGTVLEVANEEEIREDVCMFQDAAETSVTEDSNPTSKKQTRYEDSKVLDETDEGQSEDKKKIPVVKTYNMRSKRLAADDSKMEIMEKNPGGNNEQPAKRRKVEHNKSTKSDASSSSEEDDDEEEAESDAELIITHKRKGNQLKKGAATKAKPKGKGKTVKGKKAMKGKQIAKKSARAESDDEDDEEEDLEPLITKTLKKGNARGKSGPGKRKGRPRKKKEVESSEESEDESDDSESEEEELEEIPVKGGKSKQKRAGKGKVGQPAAKKKKVPTATLR